MCYLCGPDKARKSIDAAARVWRGKSVTDKVQAKSDGELGYRRSWGYRHDWTLPPKRVRCPPARPDVPQGNGLWPT